MTKRKPKPKCEKCDRPMSLPRSQKIHVCRGCAKTCDKCGREFKKLKARGMCTPCYNAGLAQQNRVCSRCKEAPPKGTEIHKKSIAGVTKTYCDHCWWFVRFQRRHPELKYKED